MAAHVQVGPIGGKGVAAGLSPGRQAGLLALAALALVSSWYFATVIAPAGLGSHAPTVEQGLYPEWLGCGEILEGRSPYRGEVTQQIAVTLRTGTTAASLETSPRFAYPVFLVALYWPLAILPFAGAQLIALDASIVLLAISIPLWCGWPAEMFDRLIVAAAVFSGYPVALAIQLRQPTLLFVALLAVTVWWARSGRLVRAGMVGALCAAKPQLAVAVLLPLALWAVCRWRARRAFLLSLGGTLAGLLLGAQAIVPGWFGEWVHTMRAYSHYAGAQPLVAEMLRGHFVLPVSALLVGSVLLVSYRFRDADLLFAISYSVAVFQLLFPFLIYNEVLLLPAALWMVMKAAQIRRCGQCQQLLFGATWTLAGASAVAMAGLSLWDMVVPGSGVKLWTVPFVTAWLYPWAVFTALAAWAASRTLEPAALAGMTDSCVGPQTRGCARDDNSGACAMAAGRARDGRFQCVREGNWPG